MSSQALRPWDDPRFRRYPKLPDDPKLAYAPIGPSWSQAAAIALVTVDQDELVFLRARSKWLEALEEAGVANWENLPFANFIHQESMK